MLHASTFIRACIQYVNEVPGAISSFSFNEVFNLLLYLLASALSKYDKTSRTSHFSNDRLYTTMEILECKVCLSRQW